jgi:hypothetical protein
VARQLCTSGMGAQHVRHFQQMPKPHPRRPLVNVGIACPTDYISLWGSKTSVTNLFICHCSRPQDATTHVVPNLLYINATNSPEACEAAAKAANYSYFAMQKGNQCWWVVPACIFHGEHSGVLHLAWRGVLV